MWQSPVYCNSLENCRVERHREFESHRFRQIIRVGSVIGNISVSKTDVGGSWPSRLAIKLFYLIFYDYIIDTS